MQVEDVLEKGIADGTQIGAQLYVSRHGSPIVRHRSRRCSPGRADDDRLDDGLVLDDEGRDVGRGRAAVGAGRARSVDDLVVRFIPEFGAHGKDGITLRHLLTHTAGIPNADGDPAGRGRGASRAPTTWPASTPRRSSRVSMPGTTAGYHAAAGMSRARRDRRADERPAVRRVRARRDLRAARDARLLGRDARGSLRRRTATASA